MLMLMHDAWYHKRAGPDNNYAKFNTKFNNERIFAINLPALTSYVGLLAACLLSRPGATVGRYKQ